MRHRREAGKPRSRPAPTSQALDTFQLLCQANDLPVPETEVVFAPPRKWRADYLWRYQDSEEGPILAPSWYWLIVEQNGGIWAKGGHSSGSGLLRDYEKLNAAQLLGYKYLIFTPKQLASGDCLPAIRQVLGL